MRQRQRILEREGESLMKKLWSKYVIWEMDVGHITTLLQKFKRDNIDLQKLLLGLTIILLLMFGHLLALFLKWLLEIFCLSQEKDKTMTRMMIIWLK